MNTIEILGRAPIRMRQHSRHLMGKVAYYDLTKWGGAYAMVNDPQGRKTVTVKDDIVCNLTTGDIYRYKPENIHEHASGLHQINAMARLASKGIT